MSTSTTEQEVTGPSTSFGDANWAPPEGAMWIPVAPAASPTPAITEPDEVATSTRSAAPTTTSHRKHIGAIGAAGGIVGGVALWQAFGVIGLLAAGGAAAGLVAAPVAAYALYKRRGRNRTPMGRKPRGQGLARRATSRLSSTGLGRGRGLPKLGGGKGMPKLGGKSGRLGGGKSGKLLGGKGAKLGGGKSGLGGGRSKSGLLGSRGRGGKLLGGGRGSGLGGKSRLGRKGGQGLLSGGRSRGRSATAANRSGGITGRARRGGLNLGKRSGKAAHGALGRWSKSTGAGAGILGRKTAASARRRATTTAQRAANTRAGRRVAKAVQAAKHAHGRSTAKSPFARWRAATRAAYSQMPQYGRPYSNWATGVGAGVLALLALLDLRLKAWKAKRQATPAAGSTNATGNASTSTGSTSSGSSSGSSGGSGSPWTSSTTHGGAYSRPTGGTPFTPPPQPPPTIKVEVIRDEPMPPASLGAAPLAIGPGPIRKENMGFALLDAAMEFSAAAAKYAPPSAHDLAPEFDQLPEVMANLAAGLRHYARRIDEEEPVEQPVADALFELFNGINQLIKPAEEIGPLHRQIHQKDIAREEAPRRNEARWDTRRR